MILRTYTNKDHQSCFDMLTAKGLKLEGMRFDHPGFETHVLEDKGNVIGFFTLTPLRKVYALQHFCVERPNLHHTKLMERFMRFVLLQKGCPVIIIGIDNENKRLKEAVEIQYGKKPYTEREGYSFYSVNVLEGVPNG